MLQVLGSDPGSPGRILNALEQFEWFDLTGKELKIAETAKEGVIDITLDMYQAGRKTPTLLHTIASITIESEVVARFEDDPQLEPTIAEFSRQAYQETLKMVSDSISNAFSTRQVVNLSGIKTIEVNFSQRIERDEDDNIVATDVIAQVHGNSIVYIYSPAGVFDEG